MPLFKQKMEALKHAVEALEQVDVYVGNGHLIHHGNKSKWTSATKTFTWRAIASLITAGVVYIVSGGQMEFAVAGGLLDVPVKLLAYYGHERIWLKLGAKLERKIIERSAK